MGSQSTRQEEKEAFMNTLTGQTIMSCADQTRLALPSAAAFPVH